MTESLLAELMSLNNAHMAAAVCGVFVLTLIAPAFVQEKWRPGELRALTIGLPVTLWRLGVAMWRGECASAAYDEACGNG